jgi:hypothetical protein
MRGELLLTTIPLLAGLLTTIAVLAGAALARWLMHRKFSKGVRYTEAQKDAVRLRAKARL